MTQRNKKREKSNSEVERVTMERKEDIVTWEKIMRLKRHEPLFIQTIFSYSHTQFDKLPSPCFTVSNRNGSKDGSLFLLKTLGNYLYRD